MPILFYGMENLELIKTNVNQIERIENNILRSIYNLPKKCRTTNLKLINNITNTFVRLKYIQINFFERLLSNSYTKILIKELLQINNQNDYISKIINILDEVKCVENTNIIEKCNLYKYSADMALKASKRNNSDLNELYTLFNSNGNSDSFYNLLRYDRDN